MRTFTSHFRLAIIIVVCCKAELLLLLIKVKFVIYAFVLFEVLFLQ
jgi:hypothetical protein